MVLSLLAEGDDEVKLEQDASYFTPIPPKIGENAPRKY